QSHCRRRSGWSAGINVEGDLPAMNPIALTLVSMAAIGCAAINPTSKNTALGPPASYTCHRAPSAITIDGKLDDPAWAAADWTNDFIDVRGPGFPKPHFRTRCKLLWDDKNLYIA